MPANTPRGLPYPLPTEPVTEGAQAIRNLAEAVDTRLGLRRIYNRTFTPPANLTSTGYLFWPDPTGITLTPPQGATFLLAVTTITGMFNPTGDAAFTFQQQAGSQAGAEHQQHFLNVKRATLILVDEIPVAGVNGLIISAKLAGGSGACAFDAGCRLRYDVGWR